MTVKPLASGTVQAAGSFKKQAKRGVKQVKSTVQRQAQKKNLGSERELWLPNAQRPAWLDGSLPGDRGFDPLGLAKPREYIQFALDAEGAGQYQKGELEGNFRPSERYVASSPIAPWNDAFGLDRFRENEIINGRWAMLACLGIVMEESITGVPWHEAGKAELAHPTYWGQPLPFSISQTVVIEVVAVGLAEIFRSRAQDTEDRIYPGGVFDPLQLATPEYAFELREAEVKHCRLAMTAFAGLGIQAMVRGTGAFASIAQISADVGVNNVPPLPAA